MGIVAALIIAAVTTFVINKDKESPIPTAIPTLPRQADIKILNLPNVTLASSNEAETWQVEVLNEGNLSAERCQIQMNDETGSRLTNSSYFGLIAGETEMIDVLLGPFDQSLEMKAVTVNLQVICASGQSQIYKVVLSILP